MSTPRKCPLCEDVFDDTILATAKERAEAAEGELVMRNNSNRRMARFVQARLSDSTDPDYADLLDEAHTTLADDRTGTTPWLEEAVMAKSQLAAANEAERITRGRFDISEQANNRLWDRNKALETDLTAAKERADDEGQWATAASHAECEANDGAAAAKAELTAANERYEELRQIIDRGSESMTHEDAVREMHDRTAANERAEKAINPPQVYIPDPTDTDPDVHQDIASVEWHEGGVTHTFCAEGGEVSYLKLGPGEELVNVKWTDPVLAARVAEIERLGKIIDDLCDAAMAARSFANAEADDGTVLAIDLAVEAARKEN